jgi:nitroreductase
LELEKVILKRRMVRNFQPRPVSMQAIERILTLALHAPSAGFSQGWAYVVVSDEQMKRRVGKVQGEEDYFSKRFHKFVSEAPVLIVACTSEQLYHERYREPDKLQEDGTEIHWPAPYWYFDMGCACMLIFLAAVNQGLVTAFTGVERVAQMKQLLGIPEYFQPVGVISVGYPATDVKSPSLQRGRKPLKEVIHYEHW